MGLELVPSLGSLVPEIFSTWYREWYQRVRPSLLTLVSSWSADQVSLYSDVRVANTLRETIVGLRLVPRLGSLVPEIFSTWYWEWYQRVRPSLLVSVSSWSADQLRSNNVRFVTVPGSGTSERSKVY